jgi:hypothetical protein
LYIYIYIYMEDGVSSTKEQASKNLELARRCILPGTLSNLHRSVSLLRTLSSCVYNCHTFNSKIFMVALANRLKTFASDEQAGCLGPDIRRKRRGDVAAHRRDSLRLRVSSPSLFASFRLARVYYDNERKMSLKAENHLLNHIDR